MKYTDYVDLNYRPAKSDLVCEFYVEPAKGVSMKKATGAVASESSIGTWTTITKAPPRINKLGARVFLIKGNYVKIAYPFELFELGNMPQILSSIAGNIFGMKDIANLRLEDIKWPYQLMKSFEGPKYGIKGIRKILKIPKRPLIGTIVKPKVGLNSKEHAKVAYESWIGGLDLVKMDENLTSLKFNKFGKNVRESLKMRRKAEKETGEKKIYVPNVTAETTEMLRRARLVKKEGGRCVMIDIITVGWSALQTLRNENLNLILHGHRAGHAMMTRNPKHGISMLVIADIARLIGIDQLHIGTIVGKMAGERQEVTHISEEIEKKFVKERPVGHTLAESWGNIKPVFVICSGGIHPGHIPRIVKFLGKDIILQFGGGCHGHPNGTFSGAKAINQALCATMQNIPLKKCAKTHPELKMAIDKWGVVK